MNRMTAKHLDKVSDTSCPLCGSKELTAFFENLAVPVFCNLLWTNREAARNCPRGDIKLAFCSDCGYILNVAFDPNLLNYKQEYENPLDYSRRFQVYRQSLAKRLVKQYGLYNKDIISIGCGKGTFLCILCELGNNRGVGFDPSCVEQEPRKMRCQVRFVRDFYSEKYSDYPSDFIVCRQVLEHIFNLKDFLKMLRRIIGNHLNTGVFFEVPNAMGICQNFFIWDIIYEHYSYFTPVSLSRAFSSSGFQVRQLNTTFEGQFLCIHALPSNNVPPNLDCRQTREVNRISECIKSFAAEYENIVGTWRRMIEQTEDEGQVAVVWGAGAKGVTFLNTFRNSHIEYAVDINPKKQGKYVAGTGQQIVSPDFLRHYRPDVIIVVNPIYAREIQRLVKKLGFSTRFEHFRSGIAIRVM